MVDPAEQINSINDINPNTILIIVLATVLLVTTLAEWIHSYRLRRLAGLAFGPKRQPRLLARLAPAIRVISLTALAWAVTTLYFLPAKIHQFVEGEAGSHERHLILLLDVSPSMRLEDAGPLGQQSRRERCKDLVASFLQRVSTDQYKISILSFFNGTKPVVVDTKDGELVKHIMEDLPLYQAFQPGKTKLYEGLKAAAKTSKTWGPKSTTLIVLTDGDTESAKGVPTMPASVANVLFIGVGDTRSGSFIAGKQSRQEASALRQVAVRMHGEYFDGNTKHIPTKLLLEMQSNMNDESFVQFGRREYALLTTGLAGLAYALLPLLLHYFGTGWQPGVRRQEKTGYAIQSSETETAMAS